MAAAASTEGYFSVTPKTDCPHIEVIKQTDHLVIDVNAPCLICSNVGENWICLVCSEVYCSRYVKEHMVKHNESTGHAITLSFSDLSVWCYNCESSINSPVVNKIRESVKKAMESIQPEPTGESDNSMEMSDSNPDSFEAKPNDVVSPPLTSKGDDQVEGATALSTTEPPKQQVLDKSWLVDKIKGVIYGNCIGDAIGLLTEFMDKSEAKKVYGTSRLFSLFRTKNLEYEQKYEDGHRRNWIKGDWTDDSDQMILILRTLLQNKGQFDERYFADKLKYWVRHGYPELGDVRGCGLGRTTYSVLSHIHFLQDPHKAARVVWEGSGRVIAPNGGVMRTSILGTMEFDDLKKVIANTESACMVTHADPRCIASCVAVTVAIALMLQGKHMMNSGQYDVEGIMNVAHGYAQEEIENKEHKKELSRHMFADSLEDLRLDEPHAIGYTLKCLGAGFWAFRQSDFRDAIQKITMEAGDADTNCAVAGALLGCKLGFSNLPDSWITGLAHREWLDDHIERYLALLGLTG